jgi:hypothetical protein
MFQILSKKSHKNEIQILKKMWSLILGKLSCGFCNIIIAMMFWSTLPLARQPKPQPKGQTERQPEPQPQPQKLFQLPLRSTVLTIN